MLLYRVLAFSAVVAAVVNAGTIAQGNQGPKQNNKCSPFKQYPVGSECNPIKTPAPTTSMPTTTPAPTTSMPTTTPAPTTTKPTPTTTTPAPITPPPATNNGVSSYNWCGKRKWIVLTFDDFFGQPALSNLLADLKQHSIKATFYVAPGQNGDDPDFCTSLASIIADGHEINSHTYSHPHMLELTQAQRDVEIKKVEDIVYGQCGVPVGKMKQFRPPYGELDRPSALAINAQGYTVVSWTYDPQDWDGSDRATVFGRSKSNFEMLEAGSSAVILHHTWAYTASGTQGIIANYASYFGSLGYEFVTGQQCFAACLADGNCKHPTSTPGVYDKMPVPTTTTVIPTTSSPSPSHVVKYFGTANDNPAQYGDVVPNTFNMLVAENCMKWGEVESEPGVYNYAKAHSLIAYAKEHNILMRGHVLIWHGQLPDYVYSSTWTPQTLEELMEARIKNALTELNDETIVAWDVVNEALTDDGNAVNPYRQSLWYNIMGPEFIPKAFTYARKYAREGTMLFYNDYNIDSLEYPKATHAYNLVKGMLEDGIPIDGIGFQAHLSTQYGAVNQMRGMKENFQRFSDLGLKVHITELDVSLKNMPNKTEEELFALQAEWYANVADACVAVENCEAFVVWGVSDKDSWRADGKPLLFDANLEPKPAYYAVKEHLML